MYRIGAATGKFVSVPVNVIHNRLCGMPDQDGCGAVVHRDRLRAYYRARQWAGARDAAASSGLNQALRRGRIADDVDDPLPDETPAEFEGR